MALSISGWKSRLLLRNTWMIPRCMTTTTSHQTHHRGSDARRSAVPDSANHDDIVQYNQPIAPKRLNAVETRVAETLIMDVRRYDEKHEAKLREKAKPESMLSITLLEEEFRAEMAVCLGRVETRLREKLRLMEEANHHVSNVLAKPYRDVPALLEAVKVFNGYQEEAYEARRDLIVQRHSAGFRSMNHDLIMRRYPIPPKKRVKMDWEL